MVFYTEYHIQLSHIITLTNQQTHTWPQKQMQSDILSGIPNLDNLFGK